MSQLSVLLAFSSLLRKQKYPISVLNALKTMVLQFCESKLVSVIQEQRSC